MSASGEPFARLADRAVDLIPAGGVIGLGSGRTAAAFVQALGRRVAAGLKVQGVPTSQATAELAQSLGIPLLSLAEVDHLDVDVDGADEVDPQCNLIKGLGGALVREKIVAASARRLIIVVGGEKAVPKLGSRGVLPVEVIPFGMSLCMRRFKEIGVAPVPRQQGQYLFVSDNGNHILDCKIEPLDDPAGLEKQIRSVPGVVDTGFFLGMATTVLIDGEEIRELSPLPPSGQRG